IRFLRSIKCLASLGKIVDKGRLMIYVGKECENTLGIIRSLGIIYEHCRINRNFFIKVYEENIAQSNKEDFQIFLPYEYKTLMHFVMYTGSKNTMITLIPKDLHYKYTVVQQESLTFNGVKTLNMHYCSEECHNSISCYNYGYQDPNHCYECICIYGFEGMHCEKYTKLTPWCGAKELFAKEKSLYFRMYGKKNVFIK
ncbi:Astacin-like metalloendopeptidase, partial [Strongyloides ratti]